MDKQNNYKILWDKVFPLLKKAKRKDFILHTLNVVKAVKELLKEESGDSAILIPAAYLHDVGWSKVGKKLQLSNNKEDQLEALHQHIDFAPDIISPILTELNFEKNDIDKIIKIVTSHKFIEPKDQESKMLIDADTLSDTYLESFASDLKSYEQNPKEFYDFRRKNTFYTQTAKRIFSEHLKKINKVYKCYTFINEKIS